jgi:hypothetical protein
VSEWPARLQSSLPGAWKPGQVNIRFSWEGGRPEFARDVFLFGRLESRVDPRVPGVQEGAAGPVRYPSQEALTFEDVPNDKELVVIVEFREDDAPLSQLLFYGLSQTFVLKPSRSAQTNTVDVLVPIVPRPRLEGVAFVDAQGNVLTTPINTSRARLTLQTDRGGCVQFSATTEFTQPPTECAALDVPAQTTGMMHTATVAEVMLPECQSPCQAQLFVRVLDENRVPSPLGVATVARDTTPPTGRASPGNPLYGLGSTVEYTLVTSEPLRGGAPPVPSVTRGNTVVTDFFGPGVAVSPTTFRYEHVVQTQDAGRYSVAFSLTDTAGNGSAADVPGEPFDIMAQLPVVESFVALNAMPGGTERVSASPGFNTVRITLVLAVNPALPAPTPAPRLGSCGPVTNVMGPQALGNGRFLYVWDYAVCALDMDGYVSVVVDVVDAAGNRTNAGTSVLVDQQGPGLLSAASLVRTDGNTRAMVSPDQVFLARQPFQGNLVPAVRIAFWSSERLRVAPTVTVGSASATLIMGGAGEAFHVLEYVPPASQADGPLIVAGQLEDSVGNVSTLDLGTIHLDTSAPAVNAANMVHVRKPWGTNEQAPPLFAVRAPDALEEGASLEVYLPGLGTGGLGALLGTADTGLDGMVPNGQVTLLNQDAPGVLVVVRDRAGNRSVPAAVSQGQWVATLRDGPGYPPNPHQLTASRWLSQGAPQPSSTSSTASTPQRAAVTSADGTTLAVDTTPDDPWIGVTRAPVGVNSAFALTYDAQRNRALLVGGVLERTMETWWWDNVEGWQHADPQHHPDPRAGFGLAFHAATATTLLSGGSVPAGGGGVCPDGTQPSLTGICNPVRSWTFDGVDWTAHDGGVQPPGRENPVLAYDPTRQQAVLFGGLRSEGTDAGVVLQDTWTFDGVTWTNQPIAPFDAPPPRTQSAAAFHAQRGVVTMFGGGALLENGVCPAGTTGNAAEKCSYQDRWDWNGVEWLYGGEPPNTPGPRAQHAMVAAPSGDTVWLAGGSRPMGGGCGVQEELVNGRCLLRDTWEQQGDGGWVALASPDAGVLPPSVLSLTADTTNPRVLGYAPGTLWERSAVTGPWRALWTSPAHLVPASLSTIAGITAVAGKRPMAPFPPSKSVFLFGGTNGRPTDPVWRWDGATWTMLDTVAGPAGVPAGRVGHTFTWMPDDGHILLLGGINDTGADACSAGGCQDVWSFDGQGWTRLPDAPAPQWRRLHAAAPAWSASAGRTVLLVHGGKLAGQTSPTSSSALFDGNTWTNATGSPPRRSGAAMAHDPVNRRTYLFGGEDEPSVLGDLWSYEGGTWSLVNQGALRPSARALHALEYSPDLGGVVLYGGVDNSCTSALARCAFLADAWLWKDNAWTRLLDEHGEPAAGQPRDGLRDGQPRALGNPSLAYDPARQGLLLRGDGVNSWTFTAAPAARQAGVVWDVDVSSVGAAQFNRIHAVTVAGGTSGARAQVFHHVNAAWTAGTQNTAPSSSPAPVPPVTITAGAQDCVDPRRATISLRVDSVASGQAAATAVDALEITVDYSR